MALAFDLDIQSGSMGEKVAAGISMGLQLTSGEKLSEITSTLQGTAETTVGAAMNVPDAFIAKMLDEMMALLGETGALDTINKGVNAALNMISLGKQGITLAKSVSSISANVMGLVEADTLCVPSVKESFSMIGKSFVEILMSAYETAKQLVLDLYNSMICTSQDAVIDNVVASINGILNKVEPILEPILKLKTGYSIHEVRIMCNQGFMLYRMLQRVSQENKLKRALEKKRKEQAKKNAANTVDNTKEDLKNATNDVKEDISDDAKRIKNNAKVKKLQLKQEAKAKVAAMTEDLNKDLIKLKLLDWVKKQSIILQNAFNILIFKDMIDNIKIELQKLQGQSIENLADFMGVFLAFKDFFELIGITPNSKGLTQDDFKALAIATLGGTVATAIDVAHQVESNANQVLNENVLAGRLQAKNALNSTMNSINNAQNSAINSTSDISGLFSGLSNSNVTLSMNINNMTSNLANVNNITSKKSNDSNSSQLKYYEYSTKEGENDNTTDVDMTLYGEPSSYINDFIKEIFNKEKLDNGNRKKLLKSFNEVWDTNQEKEFVIETKSNKFIRFYKFKTKADKEKIKQEEANANALSDNKNLLNQGTSSLTNNNNAFKSLSSIKTSDTADLGASIDLDNFQMPKTSVILDNVDANINAEGIQAVLAGKVLIFDEIVLMLKIFLPVIEVLKILIHLIENYKINKAYAEGNAHLSLADAFADAARLIQGLLDIINLKDTNFFTVRTKKVSDYCINTFNVTPDKAKMATINILETVELNTYLSINMIPHELDILKGTTLYFDGYSIEEDAKNIENGTSSRSSKKDGTFDGIDTLEYDLESGIIYYDKEGRSTLSSHIMRALKKGLKPFVSNVPETTLEEHISKLQSFINAITVQSDEFEGTQAISLQDMNLCPPVDLYEEDNNDKIDKNKQYIIEFGDEWTLGDKMEYKIKVKPGLSINDKTILAEIKQKGKWIPIRSKFTNGVVKETEDHEFFRLYPGFTDRHIIIGDVSISDVDSGFSMGIDLDVNDVSKYGTNMSDTVEIGLFILNNMVPSTLPIILFNADRLDEKLKSDTLEKYKNNVNTFNNAINNIVDNAGFNGGEDSPFVKKINSIEDPNLLESIGNDMLNMNDNLINQAIKYYNNAKNIKSYGSYDYVDCTRLAIGGNELLKSDGDVIPYYNYYTNLLMRVHDSKNEYVLKYKQILKNIIANRIEREKYNLNYLIDEFNTLYKTYFTGVYDLMYKNENFFNKLERDYNSIIAEAHNSVNKQVEDLIKNQEQNIPVELQIKDADSEETKKYKKEKIDSINALTKDKINAQVNSEDSIKKREFDKFKDYIMQELKKYTGKDSGELSNFVLQLTNLFYFVKEVEDIETLKTHVKQVTTSDMVKQHFNDIYKAKVKNDQDDPLLEMIDNFKFDPAIFMANEIYKMNVRAYLIYNNSNVPEYVVDDLFDTLSYYMKLLKGEQINDQKFSFIISYELIKDEAKMILSFWDEILQDKSKYNIKNAVEEFKIFANSFSSNATWPEPIPMNIENIDFDLYLFSHHKALEKEKEAPKINLAEMGKIKQQALGMLNGDLATPTATIDDLGDPKDWPDVEMPQLGQITMFDYLYWLIYMLNATLITLIPMYWGDGFDIPPVMVPTLLPAIYFPIAPPIHIHVLSLNVLIVFGLAFRGIWPAPIILFVNMSDRPIDVMLPVMMVLDAAKMILELIIMLAENMVPMIIKGVLNQYNMESNVMKKKEDKFKIYKSLILSIPIEDKALIEQEFKKSLHEKMDKRQVVTRTEKLGQGPEPM